MTAQRKTLTTEGVNIYYFILIILNIVALGACIYLIKHFFEAYFPDSLAESSGLCQISSFFNCDAATYSPIAHINGIPLAVFGLIFSIVQLLGLVFPGFQTEQSNKTLSLINAIGCVALFCYSIIFLKSLCPFCTLYYVMSWLTWAIFHFKSSLSYGLNVKIISWQFILLLTSAWFARSQYFDKYQEQSIVSQKIIQEFISMPSVGDPEKNSGFYLQLSSKSFNQSPLRLSIFSDFECPFCKKLSEQLQKIKKRYPDTLSIQYFFYPLDQSCNTNVKHAMHEFACQAAELAACDAQKFPEIHDVIFDQQEEMSVASLNNLQKKFQLQNCFENSKIKEIIQQHIQQGESFDLKSTPTIILNGKKIEGSIPTIHFFALLDYLLEHP